MFAIAMRPRGRDYCSTPSRPEKPAGRAIAPPKSPCQVTLAPRCSRTGRAWEGHKVRRDESLLEIIMDGQKKTPRHEARGAVRACEDTDATNDNAPASIRPANWWGRQACTCRGAGQCLCCRRFDRAIRAHQSRVAIAGGC